MKFFREIFCSANLIELAAMDSLNSANKNLALTANNVGKNLQYRAQ